MTENITTTEAATTEAPAFRSPLRDMADMLSDLVSIAEIAARTKKSQPAVHAMLKGKAAPESIPGPHLGQRGSLYSWAEVEDFLSRKVAKREASLQKKIDAGERAKALRAKAEAEAESAAAKLAALRESAVADTAAKSAAPDLSDEDEDSALTLDLGEDFEDVEIEEDEAAMAAAMADMSDED